MLAAALRVAEIVMIRCDVVPHDGEFPHPGLPLTEP